MSTAAVVSTFRSAGSVLDSFLRFHRSVGIQRFYLFADDPDDPAIGPLSKMSDVELQVRGDGLAASWRSCANYLGYERSVVIEEEVIARQTLNHELALAAARTDGVDWLLHIDLDELWDLTSVALEVVLEAIPLGVDVVTFVNHEAVPESRDVDDYFASVRLFKTNEASVPGGCWSEDAAALIGALPVSTFGGWFTSYRNGKSMSRVGSGALPWGVHTALPAGHWAMAGGTAQPVQVATPQSAIVAAEPPILHYALCGLSHFRTKYTTMASATARAGSSAMMGVSPFRDAAQAAVDSGDDARIKNFYDTFVMLPQAAVTERLLEAGLLHRRSGPASLLV